MPSIVSSSLIGWVGWVAQKERESLFELETKPIEDLRAYLDHGSRQWDEALARLKTLVEE